MLNKKNQEILIKSMPHPFNGNANFIKPKQKSVDLIREPTYGLLQFLKKHPKCIVLSPACKKVKGLKYIAALCLISKMRKKTSIFAFKDTDYIKPVGEYCDVLVNIGLFVEILRMSGLDNKEIKSIKNGINECVFNIDNYIDFLKKKELNNALWKQISEEKIEDISMDASLFYKKEYVSNKKYAADFIEQYVEKNIRNATDGEKQMQRLLESYKIKYEFQKPCLVFGKCYIMDFFLPNYGICIEIDGGYHNSQQQLAKDMERTNLLARTGILVVRFTNEQVFKPVEIRHFFLNVLKANL